MLMPARTPSSPPCPPPKTLSGRRNSSVLCSERRLPHIISLLGPVGIQPAPLPPLSEHPQHQIRVELGLRRHEVSWETRLPLGGPLEWGGELVPVSSCRLPINRKYFVTRFDRAQQTSSLRVR
uniref:Uncharacterized protein n=1 Tax=Sphaerodactylus townsendi TaxID=933632 RepID=A0ACB8G7L7_9SAUR